MVCEVLAMQSAQEKRKKKEKKKESPSDYGKSRHHPYLITVAKKPHMRLSFSFNFIISCHLLIPSLLTHLFHCPPPPPFETLPPLYVGGGRGGGGELQT